MSAGSGLSVAKSWHMPVSSHAARSVGCLKPNVLYVKNNRMPFSQSGKKLKWLMKSSNSNNLRNVRSCFSTELKDILAKVVFVFFKVEKFFFSQDKKNAFFFKH